MSNLLYVEEHISCWNYKTDRKTGFSLFEFTQDIYIQKSNLEYNHILFVLDGEFTISCDKFIDKHLSCGEFILLPNSSDIQCCGKDFGRIVHFSFDILHSPCEKMNFESMRALRDSIDYDFEPTPIRSPLDLFLNLQVHYLTSGMNCLHMQERKKQELITLLRCYYTKEEITHLLHPILCKIHDFKSNVIAAYQKDSSIDLLADKMNMSRRTFIRRFKEIFRIPSNQWLLQQQAKELVLYLSRPEATLNGAIEHFQFSSFAVLSRFCNKYFDMPPGQLMKETRNGKQIQIIENQKK